MKTPSSETDSNRSAEPSALAKGTVISDTELSFLRKLALRKSEVSPAELETLDIITRDTRPEHVSARGWELVRHIRDHHGLGMI